MKQHDPGGCAARYAAHECVWGRAPDRLVVELAERFDLRGASILDAGCGEGRNAAFLASEGATVLAVDASVEALDNARSMLGTPPGVTWVNADLRVMEVESGSFDVVVLCSVSHWLPARVDVAKVLHRLQRGTRQGGVHAIVGFNDRVPYTRTSADSRDPCLIPHAWYLEQYDEWDCVVAEDLHKRHAHTGHPEIHEHAITRLLAVRR